MNPLPQQAMSDKLAAAQAEAQVRAEQNAHDVNQVMGLVGQREDLVREIGRVQQRRLEVASQLKSATGNERRVLEDMANQLDRQATGAENALRAIETLIAARTGAAQPAAKPLSSGEGFAYTTVPPPPPSGSSIPFSWPVGGGVLAMLALMAFAGISYVRRIRRDSREAVTQLRSELWDEMKKVSVGVDAIAIELERIGEGQRFVTKALAEKKEQAPRGASS